MRTLILGIGNLLLSDEGFGVHFIRHLQQHYRFPPEVELFDGGTLGLLVAHKLEEAGCVYIVDALDLPGEAGTCHRYTKEDFLQNRIPVKLSPHQVGVQEMLVVSELRGSSPSQVHLLGVIPSSLSPGIELSSPLQQRLAPLAEIVVSELRQADLKVESRKVD